MVMDFEKFQFAFYFLAAKQLFFYFTSFLASFSLLFPVKVTLCSLQFDILLAYFIYVSLNY